MCKNLSMKSPVLLFPQFWHWTIWHPWWQDPTWSWHSEAPGNSLQFSAREMSAGSDSGGNLFFSRYTLFHMFWAWNPTMSQFQRLKSIEIIFFMVWIQEWGSLSWWFIAGATLRWRKIFCRTREKIEKWMEIFFSIVNSMYLYHSLSFSIWLAKSRYKYSIWFHDWWFQPVARCYWCYNYGWIVVNIHMSRDMNLASMVKYPVITWTVHPSILVENHIGEYNPLLHQSLSAAVHRGLPLIWGS
jgi:hypothetical protein